MLTIFTVHSSPVRSLSGWLLMKYINMAKCLIPLFHTEVWNKTSFLCKMHQYLSKILLHSVEALNQPSMSLHSMYYLEWKKAVVVKVTTIIV